ncbi:hypothetical protein XOCgx_3700 [Xanthomonas oryzae pv. oryzicola]|nr:hypothetical protein XOCgx_3700 [Xanthomonas oryzae pv. oryzicola]
MRPVAMTTAVRRGERQDQEKRVAESGAGPSARVHDPHANPQLVQALPRRPVREAPIRPAGQAVAQVAQPQEPAAGLRVAHFVHNVAEIAAMGSGLAFAHGLTQFYVYGGQSSFAADQSYNERVASEGAKKMLGAAAAYGGFKAIESLASWYIRAQTPGQRGLRARELGATEACLDAAVEMVTTPDDDNPGPAMNEGERIALAKDLMHLMTLERSRLPPDLWQAASGAGDDAHQLVNQLLLAARARAAEQASTSSAD